MLLSLFSGDKPYQFYVGVDWQINEVTSLTNQLMLRFLGEPRENVTEDNCKAPKGNNVSEGQTNTFIEAQVINEPRHEKTRFLHMPKQRHRSAAQ